MSSCEEHVPHSNALHSRLRDGGSYMVGPLARYSLGFDTLSPMARDAARDAGLGPSCRNPFQSIIVRGVELLYAIEEALRLIDAYEQPHPPAIALEPRDGIGYGVSEAPRGILWHRYIDASGAIRNARIVPPTSQNQRASRKTCTVLWPGTWTSPMTNCSGSASRRSAITTRASRARPISSSWTWSGSSSDYRRRRTAK